MVDQLGDAGNRIDIDAQHMGGLPGVAAGQKDRAHPGLLSSQHHGQHARQGADLAGQRKLAHKAAVLGRRLDLARAGHDAHQNGQIIDRTLFFQISRRQVDGDAAQREGVAAVFHGGPHAVLGFLDRCVGQADDIEAGDAGREIALADDRAAFDAQYARCVDFDDHGTPLSIQNMREQSVIKNKTGVWFFLFYYILRPLASASGEMRAGERRRPFFAILHSDKGKRGLLTRVYKKFILIFGGNGLLWERTLIKYC